ncbi:MAG: hypothetical protein HXX13_02625 [Bacteroidetes bacterium]|nr:hypothetical protein [Bacteroidota bacterium]
MEDFWFYVISWIIICLIFSIPIGNYAKRLGRDSGAYFLLSFLVSPILAYIILVANGETEEMHHINIIKDKDILNNNVIKKEDQKSNNEKYDLLIKIGNLKEKGIISQKEFEVEKRKILNKNQTKTISDDVLIAINSLIKNTKPSGIFENINYELVSYLNEKCINLNTTLNILESYENLYKQSLIIEIKKLTNTYTGLKIYLERFIELGVVEKQYPHKIIPH